MLTRENENSSSYLIIEYTALLLGLRRTRNAQNGLNAFDFKEKTGTASNTELKKQTSFLKKKKILSFPFTSFAKALFISLNLYPTVLEM